MVMLIDGLYRVDNLPKAPKKPPAPKPTSTPVDGSDRKFYVQAAANGNDQALKDFDAALAAQSKAAKPPATTAGSPHEAHQDYLAGQRDRATADASSGTSREHVKPKVASDPSDQKFYNMAADRENTIIDLENKAHSLNSDIDALGTSGGYATQVMQAELAEIERELDGYRLQDLRVEAAELRREIATLPSDSFNNYTRQGLQAQLDSVDQQIIDTSIRSLEGEAAEINEKLRNLPSDSFSGYARQELEARLQEIDTELAELRAPPIPYEELGVDRQQFDALVDAAMREGGLDEDQAEVAIISSLREKKAAENQSLNSYVETLLNVPGPLAEQIVAHNQGEKGQIETLPQEIQDALSRVEIRYISGTDQPFLIGQPVDVEMIGDYFGDAYGATLSADQLNDGRWATVRPFDAHYEPPTVGQIHTFLDVAGMVPVIGEFADGINGLIYLAEGDYVNAGISAAALIPVGGQAFTGARLGSRVLDRSRDLMNGLDATLEAATTVDGVTVNLLKLPDGSYAKVLELDDGTTAVITGNLDELGGGVSVASRNSTVNPLVPEDRARHILHGDGTGGGHLGPDPGAPGKSPFPQSWSEEKILEATSDIASDWTTYVKTQANGRHVHEATIDEIDVRVIIEPQSRGGGVVTAFPTNVPRNPN